VFDRNYMRLRNLVVENCEC